MLFVWWYYKQFWFYSSSNTEVPGVHVYAHSIGISGFNFLSCICWDSGRLEGFDIKKTDLIKADSLFPGIE